MGRRRQSKANADSVTRLFSAPAPAPYIYSPMLILHSLPNTLVQYYSLKVFLHVLLTNTPHANTAPSPQYFCLMLLFKSISPILSTNTPLANTAPSSQYFFPILLFKSISLILPHANTAPPRPPPASVKQRVSVCVSVHLPTVGTPAPSGFIYVTKICFPAYILGAVHHSRGRGWGKDDEILSF